MIPFVYAYPKYADNVCLCCRRVAQTDRSERILEEYQKQSTTRCFVKMFEANDGSGYWYDIAFAYDPYWKEMVKKGRALYGKHAS